MKFKSFVIAAALLFAPIVYGCNSEEVESDRKESSKVETENSDLAAARSEQDSRRRADRDVTSSRENVITRTVEKCSPAIVGINVVEVIQVEYRSPFDPFYDDPFFRRFFERRSQIREYEVSGLGSGFIISPDGYILTNHHVAGNASKIVVTTTGGDEYQAEIIGADMISDVALLKIDGKNLPYLELGDSDDLFIGEWVVAFGNPFGLFDINSSPTVTVGVVSNKDLDFLQETRTERRVYKGMIQTDAAISSGNSGGPLVNALGEVIGINTVIFSTAQSGQGAGSIGIGFSVPINRVKNVVERLRRDKTINRNYAIGIDARNIDDRIKKYLNLESDKGAVVYAVDRRSPAEEAGIEPGDVIVKVEGKPIRDSEDYFVQIFDRFAGETVEIVVRRGKKEIKKKLTLEPLK